MSASGARWRETHPNQKGKPPLPPKTLEWIFAKCDTSNGPDSCWPWLGRRDVNGYGRYNAGRFQEYIQQPHRLVLRIIAGRPLVRGEVTMHLCDNPPCCNPKHLKLGTFSDNLRDCHDKGRSWQKKVTHCPKGHTYTVDNTYTFHDKKRRCSFRYCRKCIASKRPKSTPESLELRRKKYWLKKMEKQCTPNQTTAS